MNTIISILTSWQNNELLSISLFPPQVNGTRWSSLRTSSEQTIPESGDSSKSFGCVVCAPYMLLDLFDIDLDDDDELSILK